MREIKDTIMELEALKNRKDEHEIKVDGAKEALIHAIKCCEIVEKLPSEKEISEIICPSVDEYNAPPTAPYHKCLKIAQAIHDKIRGIKNV